MGDAPEPSRLRRWLAAVASFLSSAVAIVCPLCIPALGSLLAGVGLGFADSRIAGLSELARAVGILQKPCGGTSRALLNLLDRF